MEVTEEVAADEGGDEDVEVPEVAEAVVGVVEDAADPGGKLTFPQLTKSKRRFGLLKGIFASPLLKNRHCAEVYFIVLIDV